MASFKNDQAAGLRRLMAAPKPRIVSIIAADYTQDQARTIINLGASIRSHGNDILIVHASQTSRESSYDIAKMPTLLDVSSNGISLESALKNTSHDLTIAKLVQKNQLAAPLDENKAAGLNHLLEEISSQYDVVLVDTTLNSSDLLPLKTLNENDILIQLTRAPESITSAYSLMKQICAQLGRRSFGIIVSDSTEKQALNVFKNISQVAQRFMQVELEYFGAIPTDEHLNRAAKLGRSVVDAFPLTPASQAFKQIALRLHSKASLSNPNQELLSILN